MLFEENKELILRCLKEQIEKNSDKNNIYLLECAKPFLFDEKTIRKLEFIAFRATSEEEAFLKMYEYCLNNIKWAPDYYKSDPKVDLIQYATLNYNSNAFYKNDENDDTIEKLAEKLLYFFGFKQNYFFHDSTLYIRKLDEI